MIKIQYIEQDKHRYPTHGDYFKDETGDTVISATKFKNEDYSFLIALHELIEEYLTRRVGIDEKIIMDFDLAFEEERELKLHSEDDEPGDDPRSPYKKEHRIAENFERQMAVILGVDWFEYCKTLNNGKE